jgi:RNase H-fold protein (predicted Holliday junction resolvase)
MMEKNKAEINPINPSEIFVMGLDVSTKTIGVALFTGDGKLVELTHISPKAKPLPATKTEEIMQKADLFAAFIDKYSGLKIERVVIEEPLLSSNNIYTVAILLRFNGIVSKIIYDKFKVVPTYISTYEARKNAFPELMRPNAKGNIVLFGEYPKDIDKKKIIWDLVGTIFPQIVWLYGKRGNLQKENFDMTDAACAIIGEMRKYGFWTIIGNTVKQL